MCRAPSGGNLQVGKTRAFRSEWQKEAQRWPRDDICFYLYIPPRLFSHISLFFILSSFSFSNKSKEDNFKNAKEWHLPPSTPDSSFLESTKNNFKYSRACWRVRVLQEKQLIDLLTTIPPFDVEMSIGTDDKLTSYINNNTKSVVHKRWTVYNLNFEWTMQTLFHSFVLKCFIFYLWNKRERLFQCNIYPITCFYSRFMHIRYIYVSYAYLYAILICLLPLCW